MLWWPFNYFWLPSVRNALAFKGLLLATILFIYIFKIVIKVNMMYKMRILKIHFSSGMLIKPDVWNPKEFNIKMRGIQTFNYSWLMKVEWWSLYDLQQWSSSPQEPKCRNVVNEFKLQRQKVPQKTHEINKLRQVILYLFVGTFNPSVV